MTEEEFHFRVERANQSTLAPFLSLSHPLSPLLGLAESWSLPFAPLLVADESVCSPYLTLSASSAF